MIQCKKKLLLSSKYSENKQTSSDKYLTWMILDDGGFGGFIVTFLSVCVRVCVFAWGPASGHHVVMILVFWSAEMCMSRRSHSSASQKYGTNINITHGIAWRFADGYCRMISKKLRLCLTDLFKTCRVSSVWHCTYLSYQIDMQSCEFVFVPNGIASSTISLYNLVWQKIMPIRNCLFFKGLLSV